MTSAQNARYPLGTDKAVHHWLACGPVVSPIDHLAQVINSEGSAFGRDRRWVLNYWAWSAPSKRLRRRLYDQLATPIVPPEGVPRLHSGAGGDKRWEYAVPEEDQVIDFSRFNFTPTLMQGWLFTLLEVEKACDVQA